MDSEDLKSFIREIIEENFSPNPIPIGSRWSGGTLTLKPSNDTQPKEIPLEVFFKKLLGVRESLRVLEQKLNSHKGLSGEEKQTLQAYLAKANGCLTSFNILFKDGKDKFVGSGSGKSDTRQDDLSVSEAKKKLGLNEYSSRD